MMEKWFKSSAMFATFVLSGKGGFFPVLHVNLMLILSKFGVLQGPKSAKSFKRTSEVAGTC